MRRTPAFDAAFQDYSEHSHVVQARQQMLLDIVLERDRFAKAHKLLTYAKRARCRISRDTHDLHDSLIVHPRIMVLPIVRPLIICPTFPT